MHRRNLFIATAILEGAIGLLLLLALAGPIFILLGVEAPLANAIAISRVTGSALLALAAVCCLARKDDGSREKRRLGELWAQRSGGKCAFVMPKGPDMAPIESAIKGLN